MADSALWNQLIAHWQANDCAACAGASAEEIENFQRHYEVVLPSSVRAYFEAANGQCEEMGNDLFRFWPLSEVKPVSEELDSDIHTDRLDFPGYFVFADYLIWSWGYAVKIESISEFAAPVHCLTGEKHTRQVASSFVEFIQKYLTNDESIMP